MCNGVSLDRPFQVAPITDLDLLDDSSDDDDDSSINGGFAELQQPQLSLNIDLAT